MELGFCVMFVSLRKLKVGGRPMQRVITFLSPLVNQKKGIVSREFVAPQMSRADLKGATPHVPFSHKR